MENKNLNEQREGLSNCPPREQENACRTPEESAALPGETGAELSDEQMEGVAGGYQTRQWTPKP